MDIVDASEQKYNWMVDFSIIILLTPVGAYSLRLQCKNETSFDPQMVYIAKNRVSYIDHAITSQV